LTTKEYNLSRLYNTIGRHSKLEAVDNAINQLNGISGVKVDFLKDTVTIDFNEDEIPLLAVEAMLRGGNFI